MLHRSVVAVQWGFCRSTCWLYQSPVGALREPHGSFYESPVEVLSDLAAAIWKHQGSQVEKSMGAMSNINVMPMKFLMGAHGFKDARWDLIGPRWVFTKSPCHCHKVTICAPKVPICRTHGSTQTTRRRRENSHRASMAHKQSFQIFVTKVARGPRVAPATPP